MSAALPINLATQGVIPIVLGAYLWAVGTGRYRPQNQTDAQRALVAKWSRGLSILGVICVLSGSAAIVLLLVT